jgi:hypothetical protein
MTERTSRAHVPESDPSGACCDSVLLQTCCGAETKPDCCGPETAPKVCGCSGQRPDAAVDNR